MNNCKNCGHWELSAKYETGHSLGLGRCEATKMLFDSTQWSPDGEGRRFIPEHEKVTAFVQDGSDYLATLYTKPEHHCTMFEPQGKI